MSTELTKENLLEYVKKQKVQLEECKQSLAASEAKGKKLTALLKSKMKELADVSSSNQDSNNSEAVSSNDSELQLAFDNLKKELDEAKNSEQKLRTEYEEVVTREANAKTEVEKKQSELDHLSNHVDELTKQLFQAKLEIETFVQSTSASQQRETELNNHLSQMRESIDEQKARIVELLAMNNQLQTKNSDLVSSNGDISKLQAELSSLQIENDSLKHAGQVLEGQLLELKLTASTSDSKKVEDAQTIAELASQLDRLKASVADMSIVQKENEVLRIQLSEERANLKRSAAAEVASASRCAELENELKKASEEVEQEKKKSKSLSEEVASLKEEVNKAATAAAAASSSVAAAATVQEKNNGNGAGGGGAGKKKDNAAVQKEKEKVKALEIECSQLKDQLKDQAKQTSADKEKQQTEIAEMSNQIDSLNAKLLREKEQTESIVQGLKEVNRDLEEKGTAADKLLESLKVERDSLDARVSALTAELRSASESSAKLALESEKTSSEENNRLQQKIVHLEGMVHSLEQSCASLKADVGQVSQEKEALQKRLTELSAERDALLGSSAASSEASSSLSSEIEQLKGTLKAANEEVTRLSEVKAKLAAADIEIAEMVEQRVALLKQVKDEQVKVEDLKTQLSSSDAKEKKLTVLLKQKMKELKDASTALSEAQSSSSSASTAREDELRRTVDKLEAQCSEASLAKSEAESRVNQLKERIANQEEKISSLLKEKNSLQEESFRSEYVQRELKAVTEDRDELRKRFLALENKHTTAEASNSDVVSKLEKQLKEAAAKCEMILKDSSARLDAVSGENKQLQESLRVASEGVNRLNQVLPQLTASQKENKDLLDQLETLRGQLKEENAKFEAQGEKLKKVQVLLKKVSSMNQEKDSKMSSLLLATERPKRFHIIARVKLQQLSHQEAAGCPDDWCCVLEDAPPSDGAGSSSSSKYRWVEKSVVDGWVGEGSSVISSWPQLLNEMYTSQYEKMKEHLEAEREELRAQLEDVNQQFSTYKQRAQAALKRIGNEDAKERQKAQEAATEKELTRVTQELNEAWTKVEELQNLLTGSEEALKAKTVEVTDLNKAIADLTAQDDENKREMARLSGREKVLLSDVEAQQQLNELQASQLALSQQRCEEAMDQKKELELKIIALESQAFQFPTVLPQQSPPPVFTPTPQPTADLSLSLSKETSQSDMSKFGEPASVVKQETVAEPIEVVRPPSVASVAMTPRKQEAIGLSGDKLLLYHQADVVMKEGIVTLRQENSQLMMEIIELKSDIGLRDDQILALKETIRELEATILREREFNASNRRINADYLVNILRKFLLSSQPSERSKLVPVLCNILQFQPEETKTISNLWMIKSNTGLVGWLLPGGSAAPDLRHKSSTHSSSNGGDLTYDPVTGGGIDINSTY